MELPCWLMATLVAMLVSLACFQPTCSEPVVHDVPCGYRDTACTCREDADVCKFSLTLEQYHTFTRYEPTPPNAPRGPGRLYYIDNMTGDLMPFPTRPGEPDICGLDSDCTDPITVDSRTHHSVLVVNGQMPGPTLIVYQDQTLQVDMYNRFSSAKTTTIHWHGQDQVNTPWMDGVGFLSQCAFGPGESFRYIFKAYPSGTYWYHAHMGTQRTDGIHGGLVVREKNLDYPIDFEDQPEKHTLTLLEWYRVPTKAIMTQVAAGSGFFVNDLKVGAVPTRIQDRYQTTVSFDGSEVGFIPFWSALINGKGRYKDVPYHASRLHVVEVERGKTYRFHVIGTQGLLPFRFSIDGHKLTVISMDGYLTQPFEVDYIIVHAAERYDVLVEATHPSQDNFWIRAESLEIDLSSNSNAPYSTLQHTAEAVLHYSGTPTPTPVDYDSIVAIPKTCTADSRCKALNCPFENFHESYHIDCSGVHQLRLFSPTEPSDLPSVTPDDGQEYFFNFARHTSINGRNSIFPPVSPQTDPEGFKEHEPFYCRYSLEDQCIDEARCPCIHVTNIPYKKTIRFILSTVGSSSRFSHPVHLHGHHFFVLHTGYGKYSERNGFLTENSPDISCIPGGSKLPAHVVNASSPPILTPLQESEYFCSNDITWTKPEPQFTIDSYTIRKDTILIPAGGYVVIQFISNNPGFWLMHCHIEAHFQAGMSVIINEAQSRQNPSPKGVQTCGNFSWSVADFDKYVRIGV